ncbi:hypothetical protein [Wukongibacter sp. M2B1]|uniref:hypothetical protein n=1 Tax=Wukongibacter sp. M2B1 TaxID=3088895 RepID=UPI003D7A1189
MKFYAKPDPKYKYANEAMDFDDLVKRAHELNKFSKKIDETNDKNKKANIICGFCGFCGLLPGVGTTVSALSVLGALSDRNVKYDPKQVIIDALTFIVDQQDYLHKNRQYTTVEVEWKWEDVYEEPYDELFLPTKATRVGAE